MRRAERFIYIENQYFYGSCYMWAEAQDCGCNHTIQAEITEKICRKIARGERFVAYITTPMYPEGSPTDGALRTNFAKYCNALQFVLSHLARCQTMLFFAQAVLRYQRLTRDAMHQRITSTMI